MIATEAGAEGINLQFCSLVINYDLPWNPQRIEQRIGRCHRYGQKHDVVVVNFLNERNAADRLVMELLTEKFNLFSGVFGLRTKSSEPSNQGWISKSASWRSTSNAGPWGRSTRRLQGCGKKWMRPSRSESKRARRTLLEHFDEDVHARLRVQLDTAREQLDRVQKLFWEVTKFMLKDNAAFDDSDLTFDLQTPPVPQVSSGKYHLISKTQPNVPGEFLYRLSHPLGEHVIEGAKHLPTPASSVSFDVTGHRARIAAVEVLKA